MHVIRRQFSLVAAVAASAAALALGVAGPASAAPPHPAPAHLTITDVDNQYPQLVSGGEVLVRVSGAGLLAPRLTVDGRRAVRAVRQSDGTYLGLATGLRNGSNLIFATSGRQTATLSVDNHPIAGPVLSGPQQTPFFCETTAFGLAAATMPDCSAPTQVSFEYMSTNGSFEPLASPTERPADLATATVNGKSVPYIVRLEQGVIDRAVYQIAVLTTSAATPTPFTADPSWNDKLVYTFGGGCNGGYHQGNVTGGVLDDQFLSLGYAVASSTLNVLDQNCNIVLSAEAAMMVKEHFIDTYGPVDFTIGWGGSGGSIQQLDIADAYPGILDGIIPSATFPDAPTVSDAVTDCALMEQFFAGPGAAFTAAQQQAIVGFQDPTTCESWTLTFANRLTATGSCNSGDISADDVIPLSAEWNPTTNPGGIKCSLTQQLANQLGIDPTTGFANSFVDNVGVQYGLAALNDGAITPDQFILLNQEIGGFDVTGAPQSARTVASPQALAAAYRDGLVLSGNLGLRTTPIIDERNDLDQAGLPNDIHTTQWSFAVRSRLASNGDAGNGVIIETDTSAGEVNAANALVLSEMDQWLTNIKGDRSARSAAQKVAADRPASLSDGCYVSATTRLQVRVTDPATGPCATDFPVASSPRQVAGESVAENVLKCQLRPIDFRSYAVPFTPAQQAELRQVFPRGVCDYSRPGVGQQQTVATWLDYGDGSVGTFGHAPAPRPVESPSVRR